jgi:sugar transferase (PEP-CTERM system associated)
MIRLFNVYFPTRSLVRLICEVCLICVSLLFVAAYSLGADAYIGLVYEYGFLKIASIATLTILLSYYFDLYEPRRITERWEVYFRLSLVLSALAFVLAGVVFVLPDFEIGHNVLFAGVFVLSIVLVLWRRADEWIVTSPFLRERVYVLGCGARARRIVAMLNTRPDAGYQVIGWSGEHSPSESALTLDEGLRELRVAGIAVNRIIVALEDRRGVLPIRELLNLRLAGVVIDDVHGIVERLSGILPLEGLSPGAILFSQGFRIRAPQQLIRRCVSLLAAIVGLLFCLPIIPVIALAVRLSSPGPILFRQTRVGYRGRLFTTLKFRTMRANAEVNGAVWATNDDPRITPVGRIMRKTRLDEIPQLWNVLRGDMAFVGPRPERPEFVQWLINEIPYYDLRHIIRPGLTGWAQVRYKYGASLEETKRKLEYDLYYLKHLSVGLDLLIIFETIKTIVLRRGAQ